MTALDRWAARIYVVSLLGFAGSFLWMAFICLREGLQ